MQITLACPKSLASSRRAASRCIPRSTWAVDLERERWAAVAETFLHDLRILALPQEMRGVAMTKIVKRIRGTFARLAVG